jgi:hypothetical protein
MIGIGTGGVDGLLEADLDLESHAAELDDLQPSQREVGGQEHLAAASGVDDQGAASWTTALERTAVIKWLPAFRRGWIILAAA